MRSIAVTGLRVLAAAAAVAVPVAARAQTFPATLSPLYCQRGLMIDGYRDQSGAIDERDIVGTPAEPAGFRAVDAQFLYLRMRVDVSPVVASGLSPFAWGFELSTDGNPANYEILILVDGAADAVKLYRNTVTTVLDSPTDPADQPAVMTYPFSTNGRVIDAGPSLFGGGNDAFIDMAVPWSDLVPLGLTPTTRITVWAATSANVDRLDGDFACHDGGGGTATPTLSQTSSAPLTPDPARSPGPVGGTGGGATDAGGNVIGGSGIEGGPGCNCNASGTPLAGRPTGAAGLVGLVLAAAAVLSRRKRKQASVRVRAACRGSRRRQ
jgi:MYXO-CTERM domain-containing protein